MFKFTVSKLSTLNMCFALTRTFMHEEVLVRCLPVPGTRAEPYLLIIFSKMSENNPSAGCCDFVPELNHSVAWPEILYGVDSLSAAFSP